MTALTHYLKQQHKTPTAHYSPLFQALPPKRLGMRQFRYSQLQAVDILQEEQGKGVHHQQGGGIVEGLPGVHSWDEPYHTRPQEKHQCWPGDVKHTPHLRTKTQV